MKNFISSLCISIAACSLMGCGKQSSAPSTPMPYHNPKNEIKIVKTPAKLRPDSEPAASRRQMEYEALERTNGPLTPLQEYVLEQESLPGDQKDKKPIRSLLEF